MRSLKVSDPRVIVLPPNEADPSSKGRVFERFIAILLSESYGFENPNTTNLNVTSEGIELDVVAHHRLMNSTAVAECKAYSRNVKAAELTSFYGKLVVQRFNDHGAFGLFCALPRLSPEGEEKAKAISESDKNFKYLSALDISDALLTLDHIKPIPDEVDLPSDPAVVISDEGVYAACLVLDEIERTPTRVAIWGAKGPVPRPVMLAMQATDYAAGLPVVDVHDGVKAHQQLGRESDEVVLATVRGSGSDFEYQLPASPKYFVGRAAPISALNGVLDEGGSVLVLNAQSGWGKSSLALKFEQIATDRGGYAAVFDTRTAGHPRYVVEVLRRAAVEAESRGLLKLPQEPSWATLNSALSTLNSSVWPARRSPLVIFFDQFENVFRDEALTRAFRDLALAVSDVKGPITVGFAWKTDLVGWTEGHPYQLRDEIRGVSSVILIEPFGPNEVSVLLRRLEKHADQKLFPDLRSRLRAYSQGLPWLLKKLADHVLRELTRGVTQEQLLAESLNVQSLFEADLAELNPIQQEALLHVARYAPLAASEVTDRFSPELVQSLVDRRLIVQVGDRLDTYWDTFRDFLNTGRVPVQDSYILRQTPRSVARLLPLVIAAGGSAAVSDLAAALDTSDNVIFNLSRELRLLGVTAQEPNRVRLVDEILAASDQEQELRRRVAAALRRHRAYSALRGLAERSGGLVSPTVFARELPTAFPAVDVADTAWQSYSRAFLFWISYAGLAIQQGGDYQPTPEGAEVSEPRLLEGRSAFRVSRSVPQEGPKRALELLVRISNEEISIPEEKLQRDAARTLVALGAVSVGADQRLAVAVPGLVVDSAVVPGVLKDLLKKAPGGGVAMRLVEDQPDIHPRAVGDAIRAAVGAKWTDETTRGIGGYFRSWATRAGLVLVQPKRAPHTSSLPAVKSDPIGTADAARPIATEEGNA